MTLLTPNCSATRKNKSSTSIYTGSLATSRPSGLATGNSYASATAKPAKAAAKGDVNVDRDGLVRSDPGQPVPLKPCTDALNKPVCRRIARVARAVRRVAGKQGQQPVEVDREGVAHRPFPRAFAARVKARTPSTGVSGRQPWPRFRM